ncbi:MAG: ABC transporter substrate-binding protein, partial [Chloroflexota bacterium]
MANNTVNRQVYESLVTLDAKSQIQPRLATSWKTVGDNIWEFKLRDGVKFHNGEKFDAQSVKTTFDRMLAHPEFLQAGFWKGLDKVEVVDATTARFYTKAPWGGILGYLATADILPTQATKDLGTGPIDKPIGTGPYKFSSWTKGADIVLEANPDYWQGSPKIQKAILRFIGDQAARLAAAASGAADIVPSLPFEQIDRVKSSPNITLFQEPSLRHSMYQINFTRPPFKDPRVREAAVRAIDGDTILKTVLAGQAFKLLGVLSPLAQDAKSPLDESVV